MTQQTGRPVGWPGRLGAAVLLTLVLGLVLHIVLALWPFLVAEFARAPWWENCLTWCGDPVALFWFVQVCLKWIVGKRFLATDAPRRRVLPAWVNGPALVWVTLGASVLADAANSGYVAWQERRGFEQSVETQGSVVSVRRTIPTEGVAAQDAFYTFTTFVYAYEFTDDRGTRHRGQSHLFVDQGPRGLQPPLAADLAARIQNRETGFSVPVRYDPRWPGRSWVGGTPWYGDSRNLWGYSLMIATLQVPFLLALGMFDLLVGLGGRRFAWVRDLYKLVPLLIELVLLYGFCLPLAA